MKYLLLIALFFFVLALWRKAMSSGSSSKAPPSPPAAERMVKCAQCGVNQPVSESILTNGRYYCSSAHRHEAEAADD